MHQVLVSKSVVSGMCGVLVAAVVVWLVGAVCCVAACVVVYLVLWGASGDAMCLLRRCGGIYDGELSN